MSDYDLADADHVALTLDWLTTHPGLLAALGGPEHITGEREAPWPHLQVAAGVGGGVPDFEAAVAEPEVQLTVWGHPDGSTGDDVCRRVLFKAVGAMHDLRTAPYRPGQPVVTRVRPSGDLVPQNLSNGQVRWSAGVLIRLRPPQLP